MVPNGQSIISEMCTYLTSELRTPLYSILRMLDPAPNSHYYWMVSELYNTVKAMPPSAIASSSTAVPHGSS